MSTLPDPQPPDAAHFAAPVCHNCGAELTTPFCGRCGQKRAHRLDFGAVRAEAWQSYRVFEFGIVKAAWRLAHSPGHIAREFVLGARAKHVHPLKLLLIAIGVLLLILFRANHLASQDASLSQAMELVRAYANWSVSLGVFAITAASLLVLRWRQPYNLTEHLVLGLYVHFLVIAANIFVWLPALLVRSAEFLAAHKIFRAWPMDGIESLILVFAFRQFFLLEWRRDWWRLLLAAVAFVAIKFLLVRLYSFAVIKIVLAQLAASA
ncbi:MAG: DUF3667 domain-containing protein [Xanthomonadales bacterium]|nr:DUF3667 domain-containing protein [Xanthomonadales bacterium]MCC6561352.1 DUF3667 domain-containing protein [Xanthomonadales bacterium]